MKRQYILAFLLSLVVVFKIVNPMPALARPELIMLEESNASYAEKIVNNIPWIQSLPVDGIVVGTDITTYGAIKTEQWKYNDIYKHLAPLVGTFPKMKNSYLRVNTQDMGDPFDNWTQVFNNWVVVAKAARAAGMKGIFFDNEAYTNPCVFLFACTNSNGTPTLLYPEKGILAYQNQFRERGTGLMRRLQIVWPDIKFMHAHGPYYSLSSQSLPLVIRKNVGGDANDLRGYFFAGMMRASNGISTVIDGGELYNLRGSAEYDEAVAFRRTGITALNTNVVCPILKPLACNTAKSVWTKSIKLGAGVFDVEQVADYPMNPSIFAETIYQSLRTSDGPVFLYTDGFLPSVKPDRSYLSPGRVDQAWIDAITQAVTRAEAR
jgi:hypothetical protein